MTSKTKILILQILRCFRLIGTKLCTPGLTRAKTLIFPDLYTSPERRVLLLSVFKYPGRENVSRTINHQESVAQKDVVSPAPHTRGWRDPPPDRASGRRPHEPGQLPGLRAQRPSRPPGPADFEARERLCPPGLSARRLRRGAPCPLGRSPKHKHPVETPRAVAGPGPLASASPGPSSLRSCSGP